MVHGMKAQSNLEFCSSSLPNDPGKEKEEIKDGV